MGNKLVVGKRRQVVDDKYTRPQGLYLHKDVDNKKLRKLILDSELAPCYPGDDEDGFDLEDCPICFLYYPSLNRSRCCMKGICTECFLQMRNPNSTRPTQCPFCKTSNYAVEYRGVKTKEEKGLEQIEEQQVIEAKLRMRQQELQDDEDKLVKRSEFRSVIEEETQAASGIKQPRDDEFDLDLEDIMVMEAIWQSIQENIRHNGSASSEVYIGEDHGSMLAEGGTSSPSGGLACAIAALAERQHIHGESSNTGEQDVLRS